MFGILGKCLLFSVILIFISTSKSKGQSFDYRENSVYIYNFIKYTEWPQKKSAIQIGVVGNSPVESELRNLLNKKKNGSVSYSIKNILPAEAKFSDVVIVSKSAAGKMKEIEQATEHQPILVITEKENLSRLGACISFFTDEDNDNKTMYQLSLKNCKSRGLTVNEQILANAVLIR
jgi:YfiR/HmsC-like